MTATTGAQADHRELLPRSDDRALHELKRVLDADAKHFEADKGRA